MARALVLAAGLARNHQRLLACEVHGLGPRIAETGLRVGDICGGSEIAGSP
jgi:hypothetical protein